MLTIDNAMNLLRAFYTSGGSDPVEVSLRLPRSMRVMPRLLDGRA